MSSSETQTAANRFRFLAEAVAWRYRPQGFAVRQLVRQKLSQDPFYRGLFAAGHLPAEGLVLDVGCGRGVFLALVACAQSLGMAGGGKRGADSRLVGIELRPEAAESARAALGDKADIITGDARGETFPPCRAAIVQDVLIYLRPEEQDSLLERLAAALEEGGLLILREADGGSFWRRTGIRLAGGLAGLLPGGKRERLHPRSGEEWKNRLESLGLRAEKIPAGGGAGFGKALLIAHKVCAPSGLACPPPGQTARTDTV